MDVHVDTIHDTHYYRTKCTIEVNDEHYIAIMSYLSGRVSTSRTLAGMVVRTAVHLCHE